LDAAVVLLAAPPPPRGIDCGAILACSSNAGAAASVDPGLLLATAPLSANAEAGTASMIVAIAT
jgi:hypothetical protein